MGHETETTGITFDNAAQSSQQCEMVIPKGNQDAGVCSHHEVQRVDRVWKVGW
jgi:hypothetical protein